MQLYPLMYRTLLFLSIILFIMADGFAQDKSSKRGIAYGYHSPEDMDAIKEGISWWYNWTSKPDQSLGGAYPIDGVVYIPMVWGGSFNVDEVVANIPDDAEYILGFNEPNFTDQANLTPAQAADLWPQLEEIADRKNLKIVGPALNYCGNCVDIPGTENDSDPIEWLDAFFTECPGCQVDYIAVHWYDYGLEWYISRFKKYNKPIWVTELALWHNQNHTVAEQKKYLAEAVQLMEKDDTVFRYAWFTGRSGGPNINLFESEPGELSALGKYYISLPASGDDNFPPIADAGSDKQIRLPANSTTLHGESSEDIDGTIISYEWKKVIGDSAIIQSPIAASTEITNLSEGTYLFRLRVTDNDGAVDSCEVAVEVTDPGELNVNLALNKPAEASSYQDTGGEYLPGLANDGNMDTRWASDWNDNEWITINLQAGYKISKVIMEWEVAYGSAYTIQLSDDPAFVDFETIATVNAGNGQTDEVTTDSTVSGQYLRMQGISRGTEWGYSLWEFEAYGMDANGEDPTTTEEMEKLYSISIYPNPANDIIQVKFPEPFSGRLDIKNITGNLVKSKTIHGRASIQLVIHDLTKGIYVLSTDNKKFKPILLIVQ